LRDLLPESDKFPSLHGGVKALRARWLDHLGSPSRRPVILVDEAQEMTPIVLCELRLLASARFDSQSLLCVLLAGDASLMTKELRHTLCDHAAGNYRIFTAMAAELLMTAAQRDITVLDEKLYLQVFSRPKTAVPTTNQSELGDDDHKQRNTRAQYRSSKPMFRLHAESIRI
jgi:type II secretory pathway predicted ATPase ExeA